MKTTQSQQWMKWLGAGAVLLVGVSGCADRNNNGEPDGVPTAGEVANVAENVADEAAQVADKAGDAAANAVKSAANAADNLDDAAVITPKINAAFADSPVLDATDINVTTTEKTVTLGGTVKNAAQSKFAESTARKNAPGYKVVNKLKVSGGTSPVKKNS